MAVVKDDSDDTSAYFIFANYTIGMGILRTLALIIIARIVPPEFIEFLSNAGPPHHKAQVPENSVFGIFLEQLKWIQGPVVWYILLGHCVFQIIAGICIRNGFKSDGYCLQLVYGIHLFFEACLLVVLSIIGTKFTYDIFFPNKPACEFDVVLRICTPVLAFFAFMAVSVNYWAMQLVIFEFDKDESEKHVNLKKERGKLNPEEFV